MRTKCTNAHNSTARRAPLQCNRRMEKPVMCCLSVSKSFMDERKKQAAAAAKCAPNDKDPDVCQSVSAIGSVDSMQCAASHSRGKQSNVSSCSSHRSKSGQLMTESTSERALSPKQSATVDVVANNVAESLKGPSVVVISHVDPPVCPTCGQCIPRKPSFLCPTCRTRSTYRRRVSTPRSHPKNPKKKRQAPVKRKIVKRKHVKPPANNSKPKCCMPHCCPCMCQRARSVTGIASSSKRPPVAKGGGRSRGCDCYSPCRC